MNYFLIGMMGSWKTTVSKILADDLNYEPLDIDDDIQEMTGLSISGIFDLYGEDGFRAMESKYFENISKMDKKVISTGGGIVTNPNAQAILKSSSSSFYLRASASTLSKRIKNFINRPLLDDNSDIPIIEQLDLLLDKRENLYISSSSYIIETDNISPNQIKNKIIDIIKNERI